MTGEWEGVQRNNDVYHLQDDALRYSVCFNSETFDKREAFAKLYSSWYAKALIPLIYAIQYDLNKNLSIYRELQEQDKALAALLAKPNLDDDDRANILQAKNGYIALRTSVIYSNVQRDKMYLGMKYDSTSVMNDPEEKDLEKDATSSLTGDHIVVVKNVEVLEKGFQSWKTSFDNEKNDFNNKNIIQAYNLGRNIDRRMMHAPVSAFSEHGNKHPGDELWDMPFPSHMERDDVLKLCQAAKSHFDIANKNVRLDIWQEIKKAGFKEHSDYHERYIKPADGGNPYLASGKFEVDDHQGFLRHRQYYTYVYVIKSDGVNEDKLKGTHQQGTSIWDDVLGAKDYEDKSECMMFLNLN
jgi:hypothetical protein